MRAKILGFGCLLLLAALLLFGSDIALPGHGATLDFSNLRGAVEIGEEFSGGGTSVRDTGRNSFSRSPKNMTDFDTRWLAFRSGKAIFERDWAKPRDGVIALGPSFNANSCEQCHRKDGRGRPTVEGSLFSESMVVQLSMVGGDNKVVGPDDHYGDQLHYYGRNGTKADGYVAVSYSNVPGHFADGDEYELLKPHYEFKQLACGPLNNHTRYSPRVSPPTFGLGLLEAIPENQILAGIDPDDRNSDGISGRPNYIYDNNHHHLALGRFGWKANQPTLEQQVLKAFSGDLGITSAMFPDSRAGKSGDNESASQEREMSDDELDKLLFYIKLLAVPMRRNWDTPEVLRGKAIFHAINCASCHTVEFTTGDIPGFPELSKQKIHPYTDLLLHDMGAELADDRPDGLASGREWRTPPLWGIGLVKPVSGHTRFLHDGRARNIEEAVLWHGGEAAASQDLYRRLTKEDRAALLAFLESL